MTHLTIDLDNDTSRRVAEEAARAHMAADEWVAALVRAKVRDDWPEDVRSLAGAWPDFPEAESLRQETGNDASREPW